VLGNLIYRIGNKRAEDIIGKIKSFIDGKQKIIDIGCGTCNISEILMAKGHSVFPIDVKNLSYCEVKPQIFDGKEIPYKTNEFDLALLISVLHHAPDPQNLVREAKRVAKEIVIIEDAVLHNSKIIPYQSTVSYQPPFFLQHTF